MLTRIPDRNPHNCVDSQSKDILLPARLLNGNNFPSLRELTMTNSMPLDRETAHQFLKQFEKSGAKPSLDRASIRQALLHVASLSDYQMLGICADTLEQGIQALAGYAEALGYRPNLGLEPIEGAVYIKFNPTSAQCYATVYDGEHRGVLVSCQSAEEEDINEMYGHLPLDLFG
jgi:Domain of unknown function (DUF1824)